MGSATGAANHAPCRCGLRVADRSAGTAGAIAARANCGSRSSCRNNSRASAAIAGIFFHADLGGCAADSSRAFSRSSWSRRRARRTRCACVSPQKSAGKLADTSSHPRHYLANLSLLHSAGSNWLLPNRPTIFLILSWGLKTVSLPSRRFVLQSIRERMSCADRGNSTAPRFSNSGPVLPHQW